MTQPLAFLTPTYGPDLERCELLVESMDRFAPDFLHYLVVERSDLAAFRHLQSSRTRLLVAEEVIGIKLKEVHFRGKKFWLNWRMLPLRGWMFQQILKIAVASRLDADAVICIDSDVTLVRPVSASIVGDARALKLLDVAYVDPNVTEWSARARSLLGSDPANAVDRGHVGDFIIWSPKIVRQMQKRIEDESGLPWQVAVGRQKTISEYVLYGVFVREVLGYKNSPHKPSDEPFVRAPWDHDLGTEAGLLSYIQDADPRSVGVMIHSKDGISVARARKAFEKVWAERAGSAH